MSKKIGIALGGGGARGFAHLGVLKALNEHDIYPDVISGVSAGAIAGVFIAAGIKPGEVLKIMQNHNLTDYTAMQVPNNGLLSLEGLGDNLEREIGESKIENLKLPFYVALSNMNKGQVEYHNKGPIKTIVKASASIPVLFSPVEYEGSLYCDGGIFDNIPVEPLLKRDLHIIGVGISPIRETKELQNLVNIAKRTFQLSVNANVRNIESKCDLFIEPKELRRYDILDVKNSDEVYEMGYEFASKMLSEGKDEDWYKKLVG